MKELIMYKKWVVARGKERDKRKKEQLKKLTFLYKKLGSYRKVGIAVGLTHERVRQIMKGI